MTNGPFGSLWCAVTLGFAAAQATQFVPGAILLGVMSIFGVVVSRPIPRGLVDETWIAEDLGRLNSWFDAG